MNTAKPANRSLEKATAERSTHRAPAWLALGVVVALLLGGCLSDRTERSGEAPVGSSDEPHPPAILENDTASGMAADPWSRFIDWQRCDQYASTSYTSSSIRQDSLPENYAAAGPVSDLMLKAYVCDAVVVDNHTVVPPIAAAFLLTSVIVDPSVEQTGASEFYLFGMWSTNATLVAHYASVGLQQGFVASAIEVPSSPTNLELRIVVDGEPVIEVVGAPRTDHAFPTAWAPHERFFFGSGNYTWVDTIHNFKAQVEPFLRPVVITYHPPWLQDIVGPPSNMVEGDASILKTSHIEHTFGRL